MKRQAIIALAILGICSTSTAEPTLIFYDDFNPENGGVGMLNYTGFTNWNVTAGAVDLIGQPAGYYDFFPSYGLYVDMDGTGAGAGKMTSTPFNLQPGTYILTFDLAGSQRDYGTDPETVTVEVNADNLSTSTYSLSWYEPFQTFTETFAINTTTTAMITFEAAGADWVGMLLDNVTLTYEPNIIPTPSALLLGSIGAGLVSWLRRRKRL